MQKGDEGGNTAKGGSRHRSNTRGMSRGPKKFTGGLVQHPAEEAKKIKPKVKPFRTTIDRFTDNPTEVHKGMNFALDTVIAHKPNERLLTS